MSRSHAQHVAEIAYGAFGRDPSPEVVDGFYVTLRGQSFPAAMRALEVCLRHSGRKFPPSAGEVLDEMKAERRLLASERKNERTRSNYREGAPLTPEVFQKQVAEAKAKHPHLFDAETGIGLDALVLRINESLKDPGGEDPWATTEDYQSAF